jgi:hypothetical protein
VAGEFHFEGVSEFAHAMERMVTRIDAAAVNIVREGAAIIEREAKLRAGESGRHARGTPTPAVQGAGPAIVTGTLRRSIHTEGPTRAGGIGRWQAMIGPSVIYGRRVELEYDYPYMAPAVDHAREFVFPLLARKWGLALRG